MKKVIVLLLFLLLVGCAKDKTVDGLNPDDYDYSQLVYGEIEADHSLSLKTDCLDSSKWTISFWMKPEALWLNTTLFSIDLENDYLMMSTSENSGGIRNGLNVSNQTQKIAASFEETVIDMKHWNYVVVTYDKELTIYLNGQMIASGKISFDGEKELNVLFGKTNQYSDPEFEGDWSDIQIQNECLTSEEIHDIYFDKLPVYYLSGLSFRNSDWQTGDLILEDNRGLTVTYTTSDSKTIEIDGLVHRDKQEGKNVIFTISAESALSKSVKEFQFYVPSLSESYEDNDLYTSLKQRLGKIVHSGFALPETVSNEQCIWTSDELTIIDHCIHKTSLDKVQHAVLQCAVGEEIYQFEISVLDEIEGYIMSFFQGNEGEETMSMMYSEDGLHWHDFALPISLSSDIGTGRVRDPYLYRDIDGNFLLLATMGYDNSEIYYWESEDLIEFTNHKALKVADMNQDLGCTGERAWAPEVIYDPLDENYKIFYSDPKGETGGIYLTTTEDFEAFSYPDLYFYPEYEVIDATIIPYEGQYLMFYKDEQKGAKTVFYGWINELGKGVVDVEDDRYLSLIKHLEGPFTFVNHEGKYYLYADNYPNAQFIVLEYTDMSFRQLNNEEYSFPHDVRHGSIVPVTKNELCQLLEVYGVDQKSRNNHE